MSGAPSFPPLFRGAEAADPLAAARALARTGCDAGHLFYSLADGDLHAAVIFAPDEPLSRAAEILVVAGVGLQNALGALAPPEVAIGVEWSGALRVNGARAGAIGAVADTRDPDAVPGWLVVTLRVDFTPPRDLLDTEPGTVPDRTCLNAEGCGSIAPAALLEAWTRHMLLWINRWMNGERKALHREYTRIFHGLDAPVPVPGTPGLITGVDEDFRLIYKGDSGPSSLAPATLVGP